MSKRGLSITPEEYELLTGSKLHKELSKKINTEIKKHRLGVFNSILKKRLNDMRNLSRSTICELLRTYDYKSESRSMDRINLQRASSFEGLITLQILPIYLAG